MFMLISFFWHFNGRFFPRTYQLIFLILLLFYSCFRHYCNELLYKLAKSDWRQMWGLLLKIWMDLWYWLGNSGLSANWNNYFRYWLLDEIWRKWKAVNYFLLMWTLHFYDYLFGLVFTVIQITLDTSI